MSQKALHDERTQAQTKAREIRSRVEAEYAEVTKWYELRQQDDAAKKPAYVMSEVMNKEVSEVLQHAKTLSAKEGKAFIMQLRMKFHPGELRSHEVTQVLACVALASWSAAVLC